MVDTVWLGSWRGTVDTVGIVGRSSTSEAKDNSSEGEEIFGSEGSELGGEEASGGDEFAEDEDSAIVMEGEAAPMLPDSVGNDTGGEGAWGRSFIHSEIDCGRC